MTEPHARLSKAQVEAIAGAAAGIGSTLAGHPFDVIKTRLQIHQRTNDKLANSFTVFRSLVRSPKPIRTLYRGFTPNLAGNASSWSIFFYSKSLIETQLRAFHNRNSRHDTQGAGAHSDLYPRSERQGSSPDLSAGDYFIASFASGILITVVTNPIWVLKTRMLSSDAAVRGAYPSMWAGAASVWRTEGWRGFYRGLAVSCLGTAHGGIQFAVYEPLKLAWLRYVAREHMAEGGGKERGRIGNEATLVISGAAKVVAGTVTYPYQVVRSRMQTYDAEERFGKGIKGVTEKVLKEEGWRGFYKGLGPNVVRVLPATWVTFLVYENVRFYLTSFSG